MAGSSREPRGSSREPQGSRSTGRRKRLAPRRHPDIEVARLLVKRGFVEKTAALAALKEQRARAKSKEPRIPYLQLLVKKKALAPSRLGEVQDELRRHTYICPSCEARAVLVPSSQSEGASCPRCGKLIPLDTPSGGVEAPAETEFVSNGSGRGSDRDRLLAPPGVDKLGQGTLAFGRYEILSELGRGAMGVVYRAKHQQLGKEVALKILLTGEDAREAQVARFRREAAAVQKLRHDGIVPVHDFGSEGEVYFLTMELVAGGLTLHKLWKDPERAPDLKTRLAHLAQVAQAIDYANRRGVIHRDLKPANVLLSPEGDALVADFGLAKDEADEMGLTRSEDRLGTPLFMAPEQVRKGSREVDGRVDVWALGVMLFVAVTGRYPFRGRTIMDLYLKILHEEPDWTGERSEAPDRDFGQAPKPSEVRSIERRRRTSEVTKALPQTGDETVATSFAAQKARKTSGERKAVVPAAPLTGPPPFVPPPDLAGKDVPRDLRLVIEMALAKDVVRRYESAGELGRDLERFLAGEPVRARPPGKVGRAWRRLKRHRALALLGVVVLLVPLVVVLERARRSALENEALARAKEEAERKKALEADAAAARESQVRKASELAEAIWSRVALEERTIAVYENAALELTKVCETYPDQPGPVFKRGLAHAFALERSAAKADFAKARALVGDAAALPPADARSGASLALVLGDGEAGIALAKLGLATDPKDETLRLGLARALVTTGKLEPAHEALVPLLDLGTQPRAHVVAAAIALARKDTADAYALAQTAVSRLPDDPEALTVRGLAGILKGEPEAQGYLRRARDGFATKGPVEACFYYRLGKSLRLGSRTQAKEPERALEADELASSLAPWSPMPAFWAADTRLRDTRDLEGALSDLDASLARDPSYVEAAELRGELLLARRDDASVARAETTLRDEIARFPSDRAHLDLAVVLLGRGDLDGASRELDATDPLAWRAELLRAEVERRRGKDDLAASREKKWDSKRAGSQAQRDLIALARARLLAKDAAGALEAVTRGLKLAPDARKGYRGKLPGTVLVLHALKGCAQAALGRSKESLASLEAAVSKSGDAAAEVTPAALRAAPELASVRGDPTFARLLEAKTAGDGEE